MGGGEPGQLSLANSQPMGAPQPQPVHQQQQIAQLQAVITKMQSQIQTPQQQQQLAALQASVEKLQAQAKAQAQAEAAAQLIRSGGVLDAPGAADQLLKRQELEQAEAESEAKRSRTSLIGSLLDKAADFGIVDRIDGQAGAAPGSGGAPGMGSPPGLGGSPGAGVPPNSGGPPGAGGAQYDPEAPAPAQQQPAPTLTVEDSKLNEEAMKAIMKLNAGGP